MLVQHVEVQQFIPAPIEQVWARYSDHLSWNAWAGVGRVRLERRGTPPPNGVGCVREISTLGVAIYEEVLNFEPPHRMTYRVVRGAVPIRNHLGEVVLEPRDGGTQITWRCQFESRIPGLGGVLRAYVARLFRTALGGLARQFA